MIWRSIFDFSLLTGRIFFSNPCIFTARLLLAQGKSSVMKLRFTRSVSYTHLTLPTNSRV